MTASESPSVLLQRAAELIEQRAAAVDRDDPPVVDGTAAWTDLLCMFGPDTAAPLVAWLRMAAKEYESREHLPKWGDPNPRGVPVDLTGSGLFGPAHWEIALDLAQQVLGLRPSDEEAS